MRIKRLLGLVFIVVGLLIVGSMLHILPFELPFGLSSIPANTVTGGLSMPNGIEKASFAFHVDAADMKLGATKEDKILYYTTNIPSLEASQPNPSHVVLKTDKQLNIPRNQFFHGQLSPDVQWDITLNMAAANGELDFRELLVDRLTMNLASGDIQILVAENDNPLQIAVNSAAIDLVVRVPKGRGVRVVSTAIASDVSFKGSTFTKKGNTWETEDVSNETGVVEIEINSAAADITIDMV